MSTGEAPPDKAGEGFARLAKMARVGRKYGALFEVAAIPGTETDPTCPEDWASRVLRLMASNSWSDPSFLEELSESGLIRTMCRVLPVLKANAASRATASSIQDLADLEEAFRKLRHELGLAEKRLPSHGVLGSGGTAFYPTWASVGHVCTLMLQALTHSAAWARPASAPGPSTPRASPSPPPDAVRATNATPPPARTQGGTGAVAAAAAAPTGVAPEPAAETGTAGAAAQHAATPQPPTAAAVAAAAVADTPSGASTPGSTAARQQLPGTPGLGGAGASGGSSMPAVATEAALLKLLGNKHVVVHAREVLRVVPLTYRAALARVFLTQITTEIQATQASLAHILAILKGDPAASTPAPSALPKAWFATSALLTAFGDVLKALPAGGSSESTTSGSPSSTTGAALGEVNGLAAPAAAAASPEAASLAKPEAPTAAAEGRSSLSPVPSTLGSHPASFDSGDGASGSASASDRSSAQDTGAATASAGPAAPAPDVEMTEAAPTAPATAAAASPEESQAAPETPQRSNEAIMADAAAQEGAEAGQGGPRAAPHSGDVAEEGGTGGASAGAISTPTGPESDPSNLTGTAAGGSCGGDVGQAATVSPVSVDPRVVLARLLEDVTSALCDAVVGAHGVGRMALLLRGEATTKYSAAAAYMPAALSINELVAHLDALTCVATALGVTDRLQPLVASLLGGQAMRELLGAGKVYVTTVIAAGALTRDLAVEAVVPQSLRQGYMAAVLTPLETGALLNERRAPQVLAYRNSITESSYYQVMDVDALPYGVNVRFEDEQEAEGMGVVREWLSQIAADIFSPERGLFMRGAVDRRVVHPAPHSRLQEDYLGYMRFAGRIVGLALRANVPLGVVLSSGLFNYLTGRRATLQDLQQIDPQVYTTCQNILNTPGAETLELYHVWHAAAAPAVPSPPAAAGAPGAAVGPSGRGSSGGRVEEVETELVPGGSSLLVTDANKEEYVRLLAQHLVVTVVEEQCAAFLTGVQDTAHHLPDDPRLRRAFMSPLLLEDLNRITAGESSLDPEDWAEHTDVAGFESGEERESLDMFWQLVSEYSPENRQRLLQFWTAMTHLPSGGFKALNQRLQIMKLGPSADQRRPGGGADTAVANGSEAGGSPTSHGPSADGAGPHSHRLEAESLEGEDQDPELEPEPGEGREGSGGGVGAGGPQQQVQGQSREGSAGPSSGAAPHGSAGPGPRSGGHAAPAAEPDLAGVDAAAGGAAAGTPPPPAPAAAAEGADGGAAGGTPPAPLAARRHPTGFDPEAQEQQQQQATPSLPYANGQDDELAGGGGGEDGMDYGDDEEEEEEEMDDEEAEFQRQLAMALALSLQDIPPGDSSAPEDGAQGREEGHGQGDGGPDGAAAPANTGGMDGSAGALDGVEGGSGTGADAGTGSGAAAGGEGASAEGGRAGATSGGACSGEPSVAEVEESAAGTSPQRPSDAALAGEASDLGRVGEGAAAGREGADDAAREGSAVTAVGKVGQGDAAGRAVDEEGGGSAPSELGGEGGGGAGTQAAGAEEAAEEGPGSMGAADGDTEMESPQSEGGAEGGVGTVAAASDAATAAGDADAAAEGPVSTGRDSASVAAADEMDTEDPPEPPGSAAEPAAAGGPEGLPAGPPPQGGERAEDQNPSGTSPAHGDEEERQRLQQQQQQRGPAEDGSAAGGAEVMEDEGQAHAAQMSQDQELQQEAPLPPQEQQQGQPREAEVDPAATASTGNEDAATTSNGTGGGSGTCCRALPLLPQARTCFLQLNLPVYGSLEDMRRAFSIALDNMSFGLH